MNKRFEKLSLKWRVTIMTVFILVFCVAVFAIFAMVVAQKSFKPIEINDEIVNEMNAQMIIGSNDNHSDIVYTYVDEFSEEALLSYQHSTAVFNSTSVVLCILIIVFGSIMVYLLTEKALAPINDLSGQLASIDEENISERLDIISHDEQIVSLTQSFNHVLDRLEDAFERQKLFSANASHELKTPLAVMKASIQVLKLDDDTTIEEYKENAEVIEESVNRLIKVTENLMLLSFVSEEQPKINEEIDVQDMIESVLGDMGTFYSKNLINVQYETNGFSKVVVKGNRALIYRVIYNLVENAYKYNIENGYIEISSEKSDSKFMLKISNSGQVVPMDSLESLFDAFYRLDTSRSRKKEGAGLGLSIVKSIIDYHKGDINIKALVEGGLEVTIELPISHK